jgi:GntR family transcriptional regulator
MPESMYRQIAEELRQKIESGDLRQDVRLPTELELREQYNASRNTVRDAIKLLISRGLVETRPGQGTFVVTKIDPYVTELTGEPDASAGQGDIYMQEVTASRRSPTTSDPRVEIQRSEPMVAGALGVDEGTTVVSRHQQRFIDETPWSLQTSFYPMTLVERGALELIQAPNIPGGAVAYLRNQIGLKQVGYRDTVLVRAPDATETVFFKLPDDGRVAVFEVRRRAFDQEGQPFRLTVSVYPTDRNQLAISVGEVPEELPAARPESAAAADSQSGHPG